MQYQILPNLIVILSVLAAFSLILRRLPEATAKQETEAPRHPVELKLLGKGLPAKAVSKTRTTIKFWLGKIWNFMLEAKDLKPAASTGYQIRKLFGHRPVAGKMQTSHPASTEEVKNEQYYLNIIKKDPKNLSNYDALSKYYLGKDQITDALDVYDYLTAHDPANADYHARLAYCYYQLKNFDKTVDHYKKSVTLDSSQPNRYYNLGLVLEILGRHAEAIDAISKAVNLEPNNPRFYISLSGVYSRIDSTAKALEALKKARHLDPSNEEIGRRIEKIHQVKQT